MATHGAPGNSKHHIGWGRHGKYAIPPPPPKSAVCPQGHPCAPKSEQHGDQCQQNPTPRPRVSSSGAASSRAARQRGGEEVGRHNTRNYARTGVFRPRGTPHRQPYGKMRQTAVRHLSVALESVGARCAHRVRTVAPISSQTPVHHSKMHPPQTAHRTPERLRCKHKTCLRSFDLVTNQSPRPVGSVCSFLEAS